MIDFPGGLEIRSERRRISPSQQLSSISLQETGKAFFFVRTNLKRPEQIERMREAGQIVAETLRLVRDAVQPGVTTRELDQIAEENIRRHGAVPSYKGYRGFPATICASVNTVIVHGIPDDTPLKSG